MRYLIILISVLIVGCSSKPSPEQNSLKMKQATAKERRRDQPESKKQLSAKEIRAQQLREREERAPEREKERLQTVRNTTRQTLVPLSGPETGFLVTLNPDAPPSPENPWADASTYAVKQGSAQVKLSDVRQKGTIIEVRLKVDNISRMRDLDFRPWGAASGDAAPALGISGGIAFTHEPQPRETVTVPPGESTHDILLFKGSLSDAVDLHLELPAHAIHGEGKLRLLIPRTLVALWVTPGVGDKAVATLAALLKDKRANIRSEAVAALAKLGEMAAPAVPDLAAALKDETPAVRAAAALALSKVGPGAKKALPNLMALTNDADADVKEAVAAALKAIGPTTKKDIPTLTAGLKADNPMARIQACRALAAMGGEAGPAATDLVMALNDKDANVRAEAANALGELGDKAVIARPAIMQTLKDPEPNVRAAAARTITKIGLNDDAIEPLLASLMGKDETVAVVTGKVLKDSGKLKASHVPALVDALKSGPVAGRVSAIRILAGLGVKSPDAANAIVTGLEDKDKAVRLEAARSLGDLGSKAWKAAPGLSKLLADSDKNVKKAAITALGLIGPKAGSSSERLIPLLKDKNLHDDAATALVKIGKGSVSSLVEALDNSKDFKVRVELITLLGEIGPDAEDAIKPLETLLDEERLPTARNAAKKALSRIRMKKS